MIATKCKIGGMREALKSAVIDMLILQLISEKPMYAYEIGSALKERSNGELSYITPYNAINRLVDAGYIQEYKRMFSDKNLERIYFSLTESGKKYLKAMKAEYKATISATNSFLRSSK